MRSIELSGEQNLVNEAVKGVNDRFNLGAPRDNSLERNRPPHRNDYEERYDRSGFNNNNNNTNFRNDNRGRGFDQNRRFQRGGGYERNNYNNNAPSYKRPMYSEDWRNQDVKPSYTAQPPPATEEWDIKTSSGVPSVNVYTKSSTVNDWSDNKPNSSYGGSDDKKFRGRDEYSDRSYNRSSSNNNNYGTSSYNTQPAADDEPYVSIDWDKINAEADTARAERWASCPLLLKDFYKEHEMTKAMSKKEIEDFRLENNKIQVSRVFDPEADPDTMPKPITKFEYGFQAWPDLLDEIKKAGFDRPSPIQSQMWPILLAGEDCIGIAQTGTGKTLAFLLPALIHTDGQPHPRGTKARGGPNVLVLAPTRELAIQIEKEVAKYQFRNIKAVCLYGGNDRKKQIEVVEAGVEVIIATPGRLNDLVAAKHIKIESITYLILDEADRMLDMGFEPQIRKILLDIRDDRQTVMTSATWPSGVRRLASSYMKNPYQVVIGSLDLAATHTVTQLIEIISEEDKFNRILQIVKKMSPEEKAIIFCAKKDRADSLSTDFVLQNIKCQAIHGNREQRDREQALEDIKSGEVNILIATDVASRGIDIQDITMVVNYDFPRNIEEYVHRVGRTGRAGKLGTSLSFFTRSDWGSAKELIEILTEANQEVSQELISMAERYQIKKDSGGFRGRGGRGFGGGGGRGGNRY